MRARWRGQQLAAVGGAVVLYGMAQDWYRRDPDLRFISAPNLPLTGWQQGVPVAAILAAVLGFALGHGLAVILERPARASVGAGAVTALAGALGLAAVLASALATKGSNPTWGHDPLALVGWGIVWPLAGCALILAGGWIAMRDGLPRPGDSPAPEP